MTVKWAVILLLFSLFRPNEYYEYRETYVVTVGTAIIGI